MNNTFFRSLLRWVGWLACAIWLSLGIYREVFELDPGQFGFKAPAVEASMKNCVSEDMKQRYQCKEQAILSHQRLLFVEQSGRWLLLFGPPVLLWYLLRLIARPKSSGGRRFENKPPMIKKWRVR